MDKTDISGFYSGGKKGYLFDTLPELWKADEISQGIDNRIHTAFCAISSKMTLDQQRIILIQETYRRNKYWKNEGIDSKDQQFPTTLTILVYRYLYQYLLLFLYQYILRNNMENLGISELEDNKRGISPTSYEPVSVHMPYLSENFIMNPEAIRLAPCSRKKGLSMIDIGSGP